MIYLYKILDKIYYFLHLYRNRWLFKHVQCDIKSINIGPDVYDNFHIKCSKKLIIGVGTAINGDCYINASGGVSIGKYCHIGKGLTIFSTNHNYKSEEYIPYDNNIINREVIIGDAVWLGANVTIAPGAKIGNGVIISSGSVVFGDIPDCAIIRGNPAKVIKYRDKDIFYKLFKEEKFN